MNCILRKWRLSDAKDLAAMLNNKKILNNLRDGLPYPYTEQDARDYICTMLSSDEKSTFAYAITIDDRTVGSIGAFRQSNIHRQTAELGYYLAEEYWGRGIMTETIRQLCGIVFDTTDILRIYAEPFAYNTGSRRALEKAGFAFEGLMKNNAVKNGKVLDMALYSLTRTIERKFRWHWSCAGGYSWRLKRRNIHPKESLLFEPVWIIPSATGRWIFTVPLTEKRSWAYCPCARPSTSAASLWMRPITAGESAGGSSRLCSRIMHDRCSRSIPPPMRWRSTGIWALSRRAKSKPSMVCGLRPCSTVRNTRIRTGITNQRRETYEPC